MTSAGVLLLWLAIVGNVPSLVDGMYDLVIDAGKAKNFEMALLDGEFNGLTMTSGDGLSGGDYVCHSSYDTTAMSPIPGGIWRLFGDADGNGTVSQADFSKFAAAFGLENPFFDYDGKNGVEQIVDFTQFLNHYGLIP